MDGLDSVRGQKVNLFFRKVHAVRGKHLGAEKPDRVEVFHRPQVLRLEAGLNLVRGFGKVNVDRHVPRAREFLHEPEVVRGNRVNGMRPERETDAAAVAGKAPVNFLDHAAVCLAPGLVAAVNEHGAEKRAQPHFLDRIRRRVPVPVHVVEERGAGLYHFKAGQPRADQDVIPGQPALERPYLGLEPFHEAHVVGIAAQERHRRVGVPVDERRQGGHAPAVNGAPGLVLQVPANPADAVAADKDVRRLAVENDVANEQ